MGKSHLHVDAESLVDLINSEAESESEIPIEPPSYQKRLKKCVTTGAGEIGADSDSDFAEPQPIAQKSRMHVSARQADLNNQSRKAPQQSEESSQVQSKSKESSKQLRDPVKIVPDLAESQPIAKKSRLSVSARQDGSNKQSRKAPQQSRESSPGPSSSGLQSQSRESSEDEWDPIKSKLVDYMYKKPRKPKE